MNTLLICSFEETAYPRLSARPGSRPLISLTGSRLDQFFLRVSFSR